MESSLVFFLAGTAIYASHRIARGRSDGVRLVVFVGTGIAAGVILNLLGILPWPAHIRMPWGLIPFLTGMGGLCLFAAEKWRLIHRPGWKYFSTILLGLILTGLAGLFLSLFRTFSNAPPLTAQGNRFVLLSLFLVCFLVVFGYTFPQRWFGQKRNAASEE